MAKTKTAAPPTTDLFDRCVEEIMKAKGSIHVQVDVPPVPQPRPRVTKFGVYYPTTYKNWEKQARPKLEEFGIPKGEVRFVDRPLVVAMDHVITRAKTSTLIVPRGDADNYEKATLDLLNRDGRFWSDDNQIVTAISNKRFPRPGEEPCTHIYIMPL